MRRIKDIKDISNAIGCYDEKCSVRTVIKCFSVFVALMLVQTPYMRLGTISSMFCIALILVVGTKSKQSTLIRAHVNKSGAQALLFYCLTMVMSVVMSGIPLNFTRYTALVALFVFMAGIKITDKENNIIMWVFVIAASVYAVLTIVSCIQNSAFRYYHGDIKLFGTAFDPNFIGLTFTTACALLLNKILTNDKRLFCIILYVLNLTAIVYTASRGNFLGLCVSNGIVLIGYSANKENRSLKKFVILIVTIVALYTAVSVFSTRFDLQWTRMTNISEENDGGRLRLWSQAFDLWKKSPLVGNGFSSYYRTYGHATHNTYLELFCENGIIGIALFAALIISLLKKAYRKHYAIFAAFMGVVVQVAFLSALDNRVLWILMSWIVMM